MVADEQRVSEVAGERGSEVRGERSVLGAVLSTRWLRGLELVAGERPRAPWLRSDEQTKETTAASYR